MKRFSIIKSSDFPEYDLKVTLKPCFRCNHNCWFCNEYDNKTHMWTKEECDEVLGKLIDLPEDKRKIFFYLYGGEPTLSKYWEYIQYRLIDIFSDRELFIQTQTNLSLTEARIDTFLKTVNELKTDQQQIDICSSYHLGKQSPDEFIKKMEICDHYNALGLCFFSTEIGKEDQFIEEFNNLTTAYPEKVKLKFTQIENLTDQRDPTYNALLEDDYLRGDDNGESLEYRYFIRKYPEFRNYLEEGWNFSVDNEILNYIEVKNQGIYRQFKYMKCHAGRKNLVIDHNLKVYRCNDYYYSQIDPISLSDIDFEEYLGNDTICLSCKCTDGLDHTKYR